MRRSYLTSFPPAQQPGPVGAGRAHRPDPRRAKLHHGRAGQTQTPRAGQLSSDPLRRRLAAAGGRHPRACDEHARPGSGGPLTRTRNQRSPPMPTRSLPRSIAELLTSFRSCFTAPTFETFCALVVGFWAQPQAHTVTGMLVAAGLSTSWHHSRAHRFFSRARWSADQLGLCLLELIVDGLVGAGAPVRLVVDDTLFRRSGRKIFGTGWHHDPLGGWPRRRRLG